MHIKTKQLIMCVSFIIGLVIILFSPVLGQNFANIDVMDNINYAQNVRLATTSYQIIGSIICLVSGFVVYRYIQNQEK